MKQLVDTTNWNHYKLKVNSDKGPLQLEWSNVNELAHWQNIQAGLYVKQPSNTLQLFFEEFPNWQQKFWNIQHKLGLCDLPNNSRIIDIGSGVAVGDLLLSQYLTESKFWLIDYNDSTWGDNVYYTEDYPHYNSWNPVLDAIETSNLEPSRFTINHPNDQFPSDVDCVTSYFSWCFHYPKEVYWDRAYNALKTGGKLILDVRLLNDRDVIKEISETMKCDPIVFTYPKLPTEFDAYNGPNPNSTGARCLWTKN